MEDQILAWGKAVAKGGEEGTKAMREAAEWLNTIEDVTIRNTIGTEIFGTMYEDQGQNIIDTLLNAKDAAADLDSEQQNVNDTISKMDADPANQLGKAVGDMVIALGPLLTVIASVVGAFATWVSENPKIAATIAAIVSVVGILVGIVMAHAPIITAIASTTLPAFGAAFAAIAGPVEIAEAAITAIIGIVALIVSNWEPIKEFFIVLWEGIKDVFTTVITAIGDFVKGAWEGIKNVTSTVWESIKNTIGNVVETIKNNISKVWETIKSTTSTVWETIKGFVMNPVNLIKDGVINGFQSMKDRIAGIWEGIKDVIKKPLNAVIGMINDFISGLNKLKVPDWVPGLGGKGINIPKIPALAKGTNYFKGGYALVGEQGPELVEMPTGALTIKY